MPVAPESSPSAVPVWLDLANERLVRRPGAGPATKTFALLRYLAPGQLLTKAALLGPSGQRQW